jgi:murein DD-endopeptidase MepM/ murein hydrolase activator NlpD
MSATLVAMGAALVLAVTLGTVGAPAWADDYPSWDDVSAARDNEAATAAEVSRIEGLLAGLQADVVRTQADAEAKGNAWQEADNKFQAAAARATNLKTQADAASTKATASEQRAGQMAAQLARAGSSDLTANLLLSGDADNLLYELGMSGKISEQANAIYERALLDKNTAQALTDQADVAKAELKVLEETAKKAFAEAQAASTAASEALNAQLDNQARLQQQLVVLKANREATENDYLAGVKARFDAQQASLEAGEISDTGWVRPAGGYITSVYGYSLQYGSSFHKGTDLGAGCGATIYAASGGTVIYAAEGWNGGYGNYIIIDHGGGVNTAYGHIRPGGIQVSPGEHVDVGQPIAYVGTTGNSTGCHLHFEVRLDGYTTDPVPWMANQGITLG